MVKCECLPMQSNKICIIWTGCWWVHSIERKWEMGIHNKKSWRKTGIEVCVRVLLCLNSCTSIVQVLFAQIYANFVAINVTFSFGSFTMVISFFLRNLKSFEQSFSSHVFHFFFTSSSETDVFCCLYLFLLRLLFDFYFWVWVNQVSELYFFFYFQTLKITQKKKNEKTKRICSTQLRCLETTVMR